MPNSNFVDYIKIHCKSGNGGAGSAHLRREKFVPKGGPDGGDGGRGGHVILKANKQLWTLLHLRYTKHIKATHGEIGGKQRSSGADGEDKYVEVPLGTIVKDEDGNFEGELTEDGQELIIMNGGRGGQGNYHFKSATNQTPRYAQSGEEGKEGWKILELKLLADVGLVGFPNAGKSTLLSTISAAKPKIGDYPFTTLRPNLGIIPYRDHRSFVMADIPGIIEGAHEGKGLGLRFLRHIERNSVLLFVVSIEADSIKSEFEILLNELQKYNPELMDKSKILAISKSDILDEEMIKDVKKELPKNIKYVFISSVSNKGINELKDMLWEEIIKPL